VVLQFYIPPTVYKNSSCSTTLLTLGVVSLFNFRHFDLYVVVSDFTYIFLVTNDAEFCFFICLFAIPIFFGEITSLPFLSFMAWKLSQSSTLGQFGSSSRFPSGITVLCHLMSVDWKTVVAYILFVCSSGCFKGEGQSGLCYSVLAKSIPTQF